MGWVQPVWIAPEIFPKCVFPNVSISTSGSIAPIPPNPIPYTSAATHTCARVPMHVRYACETTKFPDPHGKVMIAQ